MIPEHGANGNVDDYTFTLCEGREVAGWTRPGCAIRASSRLALGRFVLWFCSGERGVLVVPVVSAVSVVSVRARPCPSVRPPCPPENFPVKEELEEEKLLAWLCALKQIPLSRSPSRGRGRVCGCAPPSSRPCASCWRFSPFATPAMVPAMSLRALASRRRPICTIQLFVTCITETTLHSTLSIYTTRVEHSTSAA